MFTGQKLKDPSRFLDNLLYNFIVDQLPYFNKINPKALKHEPQKLAIYRLFQLFNQEHQLETDKYSLYIEDSEQMRDYHRLVKRLANVRANHRQLTQKMILEDTMLKDYLDLENDRIYQIKLIKKQTLEIKLNKKKLKIKIKPLKIEIKPLKKKINYLKNLF